MNRITFGFVWIVVFTIPFNEILVLPGFVTFTRLLGYAALAVALVAVAERGKPEPLRGPAPWAFLFVSWAVLSILWTVSREDTMERIPTVIRCLGLYWILYEFVDTEERLTSVLSAYVLGGYVCIAGILHSFGAGQSLEDSEYTRYAIGLVDPNDLATALAIGIPIAWYLSTLKKSAAFLWVHRVYIACALVTILLTGSRGGVLTAVAALLIVVWSLPRMRTRVKVVVAVAVCVVLVGALRFVPETSLARLRTIPEEVAAGTLSMRADIWRAGFAILKKHSFLGVGVGAFRYEMYALGGFVKPRPAHSTILGVLFDLGIVGFVLFLSVIVVTVLWLRRLPVAQRRFCQFLLLTWLVGGASLTWEYQKATWLVLGLLGAIGVRVACLVPAPAIREGRS